VAGLLHQQTRGDEREGTDRERGAGPSEQMHGQLLSARSYQQTRGDGDDVGHGVLRGDVLAGLGDVAEHVAMDDGTQDEVDVAHQDES